MRNILLTVAAEAAFYVYVVPFLISTAVGAALAGLVVKRLKKFLGA